jgi:DNA-binding MarR family transcriptional regulator
MESKYEIITLNFQAAEQPVYSEKKGTGMIYFGVNNTYPSFLNRLYRESPKHGAIVKGKATYIYGKGLDHPETFKPVNKSGESWNQILKKCIIDDEKYGGYYLQIIWNKVNQIASVSHIKFHKVRTNEGNTKFWVKDEWDALKAVTANDRRKERCYDAFDVNKRSGSQILFIKQEGDENDVYPLPSYFQSLNYLESDILVSRHILGMAKTGFVASKAVNFNNGEPAKEEKKVIVEGIEKQFTGSEGKRILVTFNKNVENAVSITDLGVSSLSKEDFTNVNNLIQQEIYAAHQITSPMLFGIKTEGQLGGRSELRDAYEIFKNTYVNERQQQHEDTFNALIALAGQQPGRKIIPVEPIGIEITEAMITALALPKKFYYDKMGISEADYPELAAVAIPVGTLPAAPAAMVNDNLKNLTAKQHQQIQRTVRDYNKGRMTKEAAAILLKSGYGLTDDEVGMFLLDDTTTAAQFLDESLISHFARHGEAKDNYIIVKSMPFTKDSEYTAETFAAQTELSQLDTDVLALIKKDPLVTAETISEATGATKAVVSKVLKGLETEGLVKSSTVGESISRELTKPLSEMTKIKPSVTQVLLRYSYEPRPGLEPIIDGTRPFCKKLIELDKLYSRSDIETISERVGYSVWDRRGGWWTEPDGEHSPSCRHIWNANIVLKKD